MACSTAAESLASVAHSSSLWPGASFWTPVLAARLRSSANTACACASSSLRVPLFSITYWLCARLRSADICAAIMRSASSFDRPRRARKRVRRSAAGASTRTTASNCAGSRTSNSRGMSFTTMASPRSRAARCSSSRRCCTAGWTMAFSAVRAASSPMTLARSPARSRVPSEANTLVPNRFAMAARTALPGACASRASASASMTVAPHFLKSSTTVDLPAAILPVRPTLSMPNAKCGMWNVKWNWKRAFRIPHLEQCSLILILLGNFVTMSASRLIRLPPPHHDDRTVPQRRFAVDEPLIAGGRATADDADRLELVHHLGDAHKRRHGTERLTAEIDIGAGENHPHPPIGEPVRQVDDAVVQELGFVDGDDFRGVAQPARDLFGGIDRLRLDRHAIVRGHREQPGVARI